MTDPADNEGWRDYLEAIPFPLADIPDADPGPETDPEEEDPEEDDPGEDSEEYQPYGNGSEEEDDDEVPADAQDPEEGAVDEEESVSTPLPRPIHPCCQDGKASVERQTARRIPGPVSARYLFGFDPIPQWRTVGHYEIGGSSQAPPPGRFPPCVTPAPPCVTPALPCVAPAPPSPVVSPPVVPPPVVLPPVVLPPVPASLPPVMDPMYIGPVPDREIPIDAPTYEEHMQLLHRSDRLEERVAIQSEGIQTLYCRVGAGRTHTTTNDAHIHALEFRIEVLEREVRAAERERLQLRDQLTDLIRCVRRRMH